jgi:hypothetical protein
MKAYSKNKLKKSKLTSRYKYDPCIAKKLQIANL